MRKILETPRLILREVEYSDAPEIFELDSDPSVHEFLPDALLRNVEEATPTIDRLRSLYEKHSTGWWAVARKTDSKFIGWCGIKYNDSLQNNHKGFHELGYRLIKSAWGKGYASEAALACRDHALKKMKLSHLIGLCDPNNIASKRILEKCGMTVQNEFFYEYEGEKLPCLWLEMNSSDL